MARLDVSSLPCFIRFNSEVIQKGRGCEVSGGCSHQGHRLGGWAGRGADSQGQGPGRRKLLGCGLQWPTQDGKETPVSQVNCARNAVRST